MSSQSLQESNKTNPFADPATPGRSLDTESVLTIGRDATLTLGTDALIVLDESATQAIPFHHILWAEVRDFKVIISYVNSTSKADKSHTVRYAPYNIPDQKQEQAQRWVDKLMDRAYPPPVKRRKRMKVLVNPFGGVGNAQKVWAREVEPVFAAAHCDVDVERTTRRGHAVDIAKALDIDAYDAVVCASGDGLPHEVFNGLAKHQYPRRALRQVAVCQVPCGSGNAMSLNLTGTTSPFLAALEIVKGIPTPLDLVAVTQGSNLFYSFLSQAVGIVAESDLGTESLRWMGPMRFNWGFLVRMMGKTQYPAEVSMVLENDDKHAIQENYQRAVEEHESRSGSLPERPVIDDAADPALPSLQYGTVLDPLPSSFTTQDHPTLGSFYAGNMCYMSSDAPFFVAALPSDGRLDLVVTAGDIPRRTAVSMMLDVASGTMINHPEVRYQKILAYRIRPRQALWQLHPSLSTKIGKWLSGAGNQTEGLIAIDGESVPFEPFQAEVVPGLGTVLSKRGGLYEWHGPT